MYEIGDRVFILNQAFGPLLRDFVDALALAGAKCTVFMGRDSENRAFRANVVTITSPGLNRTSVPTRFISWLAYSFAALPQLLRCDRNVRIVAFSNPPILPICAWLCSLLRGYSYSVVVYDVYPDILVDMGWLRGNNLLTRIWQRLNRAAYERAFAVITLGEVMQAALSEHFDPVATALGKIIISRPWVDTDEVCPVAKQDNDFATRNTRPGYLTAICSGNMGETHDIETIVQAALIVEPQNQIEFLLVGETAAFRDATPPLRPLSNVRVLPWQSDQDVPLMWAAAEIALITLRPGAERCSFPSRIAFALSAGCALIAITNRPGDLARLIDETGCGMVVEPGDAAKLADCLNLLANDPDRLQRYRTRARATAVNFLGRDNNIKAMLSGVPGPAHKPILQ
jgi:glycosyltransferase involved in cell wall biosynthesis